MAQDHNIYDNNKRGFLRDYLRENLDENSKGSFVSGYFTVHAYNALKFDF